MNKLFLLACVVGLALSFSLNAMARDARLDYLVNQGLVTEQQIAAAEMEGPNAWMAKKAYDVYISGYAQVQWIYTDGGDPDNQFLLKRARVKVSGMLGDSWGFVICPDFAASAALTDVGAWYNIGDGSIKIGQFLLPASLENTTSSNKLDTINRSGIAGCCEDRDLGLFLDYSFVEGKVGVEAAYTNGSGANTAEDNDEKLYSIRVLAMPMKGSEGMADGLAIGGFYQQGDFQELDDEGMDLGDFTHTEWGAIVRWDWEQVRIQGEYINIEQDVAAGGSEETKGWYILATYELPVNSVTVTPVVKYEDLDPDVGAGGQWITLGVRVSFVGIHDVKLDANYVLEDLDEGEDIDEFLLQLTASY